MTETRFKQLLHELADDDPPADSDRIEAAWRISRRRHSRVSAVTAAGASVAVVVGVVAVTQAPWRTRDRQEPTSITSPTPSPALPSTSSPIASPVPPDTEYHGVPVWWAPPAREDASLPRLETRIPRTIDLSAGQATLRPDERALAVYEVDGSNERLLRFVVLTADGTTRELTTERIAKNRDESGNAAGLLHLSPNGDHLAFSQPSSLELYDFASGGWTSIDTPDWVAEGARWIDDRTLWVPDTLAGNASGSTYGVDGRLVESGVRPDVPDLAIDPGDAPQASTPIDGPGDAIAASYFFKGPIEGGRYSNPEGLVARSNKTTSALAFDITGRGKGCCAVVGWFDEGTVGFTTNGRLLAWHVGSSTLYRVAETTGLESGENVAGADWAWRALS